MPRFHENALLRVHGRNEDPADGAAGLAGGEMPGATVTRSQTCNRARGGTGCRPASKPPVSEKGMRSRREEAHPSVPGRVRALPLFCLLELRIAASDRANGVRGHDKRRTLAPTADMIASLSARHLRDHEGCPVVRNQRGGTARPMAGPKSNASLSVTAAVSESFDLRDGASEGVRVTVF